MLIKARLGFARLIFVHRPEPRGIWRQHFIDKDQLAVIFAQFELGVGDDYPFGQGIISGLPVEGDADLRNLSCLFRPDDLFHGLDRDVLVVGPEFGLSRRCKQRLRQLVRFFHAGRQLKAANDRILLVGTPERTGDIAAHNAFDGERPGLFHQDRPAPQLLGIGAASLGIFLDISGNHMIFDNVSEQIEPEKGELGENFSFTGNGIVHNHIVGRDPVRRHHQEDIVLSGNSIHIADFSPVLEYETGEIGYFYRCFHVVLLLFLFFLLCFSLYCSVPGTGGIVIGDQLGGERADDYLRVDQHRHPALIVGVPDDRIPFLVI
ncbi:MAG: hypothetical protein ACD_75C02404G0006 [uncultured bacterium]|nr:MAG: hypothetical protein ACD_75C02404G0006 [uncultured bacterium]